MNKKTIKDIDVYDKKVLVRVDFNVPVIDGKITDDNRIKEALPTINYLLEKGAAVILMSHLGRPEGVDPKYSLKVVAERLRELMPNTEVIMADDVTGKDAKAKAKALKLGQVLLLENLRFDAREEENDKNFCKELSSLAEVYVNDAFGTAHRKHASTYGVAKLLPNAIGFLIEKELNIIVGTINNPKRPFVGILGGAKVKDKIGIIDSLLDTVDTLIIGGGMAYTFLSAMGYKIGESLFDETNVDEAKRLMQKAKDKGVNFLLPIDLVETTAIDNVSDAKLTKDQNIDDGYMGVDIGKKTIKLFTKAIKKAKTVIWNGPVGVFEKKEFAVGTYSIAKALTKVKGTTIIGGGDSASAVINMGLAHKMTHISTGGGASLKLFEGKVLPGVDVIDNL
ncbi:MAG: phosphoglycerate kinase [Firmicutes bacterium]|nr:phosphoglycerate kinase [Bacillota bacterium]MDY5676804.1 phosphoglycerate kinase [Eubacteriales bacterium]